MSVQAENSRSCSFLSSLGYNGSLVTWTVVCLTATKFNPLVLSVPGFALSNIANEWPNFGHKTTRILHVFITLAQSKKLSRSVSRHVARLQTRRSRRCFSPRSVAFNDRWRHVSFVEEEVALEHHFTTAPSIIALLRYAIVLTKQHIVTSSAFRSVASCLTGNSLVKEQGSSSYFWKLSWICKREGENKVMTYFLPTGAVKHAINPCWN
jgi:hypothetical protein